MGNSIRSIQTILAQLNYVLSQKQKKEAIIVFGCMLLGSILELIGVSAIYPFLQMMLDAKALQEKWYVRWIYCIVPNIKIRGVLLCLGGMIILVYVLKNLFLIFCAYIQSSYAAKFQREISITMLNTYLKRPYQFFLNTNSGFIIRGISSDIEGVYLILQYSFALISEILTVIVLGIFLLMTDWTIALSAMLLALVCFLGVVLGFKNKMKDAGNNMRKAYALKNQYGYQAISGVKEITVLDRRDTFVNQYAEAAFMEEQARTISSFLSACPDRILEGVCIGGFLGIVCFKLAIGTQLDTFIPVLGTFAMGAFRILPSISKISSRVNSIIYYQSTLLNTYNNLKEVNEYEKHLQESITTNDKQTQRMNFTSKLEIDRISWKYQNATKTVLENTSLYINKGEAIAFIGASGAGKSTLADIIMGLLRPQKGMVKMDGIDIFSIPHQWAKIIGYVPQSVFLIDDTVRRNVAFGLKNEDISEEKVWNALRQAHLKDFVDNLPCGLDTIVGERGVKFSGGQRQRIAIARALYEDPDIIVLDEATSALDNETETAVMESIDALQGTKTLIIVAHRLTTIRKCDRIYEIGNGMAVEKNRKEIFKDD